MVGGYGRSAPAGSTATVPAAARKRARVGGGVDPQRHAADDGDAGRAESAPERAGDLGAVARRAARADDRDRILTDQLEEPLEPAGDVEHRRRRSSSRSRSG